MHVGANPDIFEFVLIAFESAFHGLQLSRELALIFSHLRQYLRVLHTAATLQPSTYFLYVIIITICWDS